MLTFYIFYCRWSAVPIVSTMYTFGLGGLHIIEHFEKMAYFHGNHRYNRKIEKMKYLSA